MYNWNTIKYPHQNKAHKQVDDLIEFISYHLCWQIIDHNEEEKKILTLSLGEQFLW